MLIGIDLGTTNSLVGIYRDGRAELIPNALGHFLTPSAVSALPDGQMLVGLPARERMSTAPRDSAAGFKRLMGTDRTLTLGRQKFRAEELSAIILRALKADAEAHLGQPVDAAVITVPAYFNQLQRKATEAAATLAGLRVERLLNEPTAAGLAYGLQERADHSTYLVFDLGGGTFDVSVLEYFDGVVQVRSTAGDTRLGGEDFVDVLVRLFLNKVEGLSASAKEELVQSGMLWRAAEQAKRDLSERVETQMRVTHQNKPLEVLLSRDEFERASSDLLVRLRRPIERALRDARLQPDELDEVVLVGGASRMPLIRQTVARLFQRLPLRTIHPDETIAVGAAIQAGLIERHVQLDEVVLTDVMPFTLGVGVHGDLFSPIIERNSPVPISRVQPYTTVSDNQTRVQLEVRQGESPVASENIALGRLEIAVPPMPAGSAAIDVRFSYDANGLLVVDAKEHSTGRTANLVITAGDSEMSPQQLETSLKRLESLKIHPRDQAENQMLVQRLKRLYEDRLGDERALLQQWLAEFEAALNSQDGDIVRRAREETRARLERLDHGFSC